MAKKAVNDSIIEERIELEQCILADLIADIEQRPYLIDARYLIEHRMSFVRRVVEVKGEEVARLSYRVVEVKLPDVGGSYYTVTGPRLNVRACGSLESAANYVATAMQSYK